MLWVATDSADVENVATPLPLTAPVPSVVTPSMKVTVPVRVPAPGATGDTVAVKVTDWPKTDGLAEDTTLVVVLAWLTTWLRLDEVLVRKLPSPP